MEFKAYFQTLDHEAREAFAARAGTTVGYIRIHLLASPPRKIPRAALLNRLAEASEGYVSHHELLRHFYPGQEAACLST